MVNAEKINGEKVVTSKGLVMGEVNGIEIDESNWTVKEIDVALSREVEKIFGIHVGFGGKALVPVAVSFLGPVGADSITLKENITFDDMKETLLKNLKESPRKSEKMSKS